MTTQFARASIAHDIKKYYCSANWICKEFERMDAPQFVDAWQCVVSILIDERYRWFYAYDNPEQYKHRCQQHYSNITRYSTESIDIEWLNECFEYNKFLETYTIDRERACILKREKSQSGATDTRFIPLRTFLTGTDPESLFAFYSFFFEQLANVMIRQMNYLHETLHGNEHYIAQLLSYQEQLSQIYYWCTHCLETANPERIQLMAERYQQIDSVVAFFALEVLKKESS